VFDFAKDNKYAKKLIDDFFEAPNSNNMFCLFLDLLLPMAAGVAIDEEELREKAIHSSTREHAKYLLQDAKKRRAELEKRG
jgi:hypothetical protein